MSDLFRFSHMQFGFEKGVKFTLIFKVCVQLMDIYARAKTFN